jgi:hypothetical protein
MLFSQPEEKSTIIHQGLQLQGHSQDTTLGHSIFQSSSGLWQFLSVPLFSETLTPFFFFFLLAVLEFELGALHLLGRHSNHLDNFEGSWSDIL